MQQEDPHRTQVQHPMEWERHEFHTLLEQNPNYFGQIKESRFKPTEPIQGNTSFEQLHCVGLYPERDLSLIHI